MADEGGDWFAAAEEDAPPVVKPLKKKKAKKEEAVVEAPPPEPEPVEVPEEPKEEAGDDEYLDPDKLLLFKHWIRPKFLPYKYLYIYRQNYYNDVMDYLDKRSRGISREIPHAQTWAERILRTYNDRVTKYRLFTRRIQDDLAMVESTKNSGNFFYYHVKNLFDRQFSPLLH